MIIVYGSLVPFHFEPLGFTELVQQFVTVCTTPIKGVSKSDFLANILLFAPLSFFVMGSILHGQPKQGWLFLIPVTALCTVFGASIECLQLMFPPRNSSLSDILAQSIGSFFGAGLWALAGNSLSERVNDVTGQLRASNRLISLLPLYLLLIVVFETSPYDFTISPVELVHKWREGKISIVPFAAFLDSDRNMTTKSLWNFVLFLPIGLLLGFKRYQAGLTIACLGFLIAGGVEALQLSVLSRNFEPTDVITGAFAIWLGWRVMQFQTHNTDIGHSFSVRTLLLISWVAIAIIINWTPFDFNSTGTLGRLSELSLVPFADYQSKHYLSAFDDLVHKLLLFGLLGILLTANPSRRPNALSVTFLGGLISSTIELGQLFLPSRYPSISDVVLGAGASLAGYGIVNAVQSADQ